MLNLRSKLARDVLGYFFLHPQEELYSNEIARRFRLPSSNLTVKLNAWEREGLLTSRWQGQQKYFRLNPQFPLLKEYRQIVLKTVGLEKLISETLAKVKGVQEAYLYGSYARDRLAPNSDIDLLVIGNFSALDMNRAIASFQKVTSREVNVVQMSSQEFKTKKSKDPFIKSVLTGSPLKIF